MVAVLGAAAMIGCGSEAVHEKPFRANQPQHTTKQTIAALGDSITAGWTQWAPDPAVRAQITNPDPQSQYEYWAQRDLDGSKLENCGVPGERTDQIAMRLTSCAKGTDAIIIQGGTNDLIQGVPVKEIAANIDAMVKRATDLGLTVFLANVPASNFPALTQAIPPLNKEIAAIGRRENVPVLPFYATFSDNGSVPPELTVDGTHPTVEGYRRLGEMVARQLQAGGVR